MSRFFGFVFAACVLAIGTSASAQANPDWPKSLTIRTASPGGVIYVYGELIAQMLTQKLGVSVNPMPTQGSVHNIKLVEEGSVPLGIITAGDWAAGLERQRRLDQRAKIPANARAVSGLRPPLSVRGAAAVG